MKTLPNDPITACSEKVAYGSEGQWIKDEFYTGLTKREFFANSAPDVIPDWFKHVIKAEPRQPGYLDREFGKPSSHPLKELYIRWYDDEQHEWLPGNGVVIPDEFKLEVKAHKEKIYVWFDQHERWEKNNFFQRLFQWRLFYADGIIDALNSEMSSHGLIPKV